MKKAILILTTLILNGIVFSQSQADIDKARKLTQEGINLVDEGKTELAIFNMQGQKIATILNESMPKGEYVYSVKLPLPSVIIA